MKLHSNCAIGLFVLGSVMSTIGCTSKDIYEISQDNQKQKCERQFQGQALEDCMRGYEMSFEEYEKERQKVLNEEQ